MPLSHAQLDTLSTSIAGAFTSVQTQALQGALSQQMPIVGAAFSVAQAAGAKGFSALGTQLKAAIAPLSAGGGAVAEAAVETAIENALGGNVDAIVTLTNGDARVKLTYGKHYDLFTVPIDSDAGIEGLGLKFRTQGNVSSDFDYGFDVTFGVDGQGFYIASDASTQELHLGITATTP
jgi:hypothetical protein